MRLICLFLVLFTSATSMIGSSNVDSLLVALKEAEIKEDLNEMYAINQELGKAYKSARVENFEKSAHHYKESLLIAIGINDTKKQFDSYYGIGHAHLRRNNYEKALHNFQKCIELSTQNTESIIPSKLMAKVYSQISNTYQALGDYNLAYDNQMEALLIHEKSENKHGICESLYYIGSIFFYQKQYESSKEYYLKAKKIADELNDDGLIYAALAALGSVNEKLGLFEESLEYNTKALNLANELNYKTGIAYAKGNIAVNYSMLNDYEKAEQYLEESIAIKLSLEDSYGVIGSQIDLSNVYCERKKYQEAVEVLMSSLELSKKLKTKARESEVYLKLSEVFEKLNQPAEALDYTKKYVALNNTLLNEKTLEEMGKSKQKYELEKKEHENAMLKKENELLEQRELNQNLQKYVFGLITIAFLMFIWWYKSKLDYQNNVNRILADKNELLNGMNDEIEIKNKQLENSNQDLKQFAYVASHDLKEPLRMINSYTNLLQRRYMASFDDSGKEFMHYIVDAVGRMETLLDDLLDFSRAGTQPAPTNYISAQDVMVIVEANLRHRLETLNANLIVKNENLPAIKAHRTQMIQLLQNLVSNGVKFKGEKDPVVVVDCVKENNRFVFSVKDNGIGISKENLEKVFEMFRRLHTREEYEGTGIGLATCKRIVTTWGGDIWVESEYGHGCTFFFSVPVAAAQMPESQTLEAVPA